MSDLTSIEKLQFERLFDMESGYVLDFSNWSFQAFILENFKIDIYDEKYSYQSGSKANRLRAFWAQESNALVASLNSILIEYWETQKLLNDQVVTHQEKEIQKRCEEIVFRLNGGKTRQEEQVQVIEEAVIADQKKILLDEFDKLNLVTSQSDRRQRGYSLEKLLQNVFDLFEIQTHGSFKRNNGGEQIDGAFTLSGWHYIVECKWVTKLSNIRDLDSLGGKLGRSGRQTMGLFISINGWSENVIPLLKQNQDKSIILMDGYDLRSVLDDNSEINLQELLGKKLSYLNLEAEPFFSAIDFRNSHNDNN